MGVETTYSSQEYDEYDSGEETGNNNYMKGKSIRRNTKGYFCYYEETIVCTMKRLTDAQNDASKTESQEVDRMKMKRAKNLPISL